MRTEVFSGQFLDLLGQAPARRWTSALRVVTYKRQVHVERPLHLERPAGTRARAPPLARRAPAGTWPAGRPAGGWPAYTAYGLPLGVAFQLRDDMLGVFGDPARPASPPATTCARASGR